MTKHYSGVEAAPIGSVGKFKFFGRAAVYVIGPKQKRPIKIGVASDIHARFANIQTCNWEQLWMYYCLWTAGNVVATRLEQLTHKILEKNHVRGEWFDITPDLARETIHLAADKLQIKTFTHQDMLKRLAKAKHKVETEVPARSLWYSGSGSV